jgi:hypothetical protein
MVKGIVEACCRLDTKILEEEETIRQLRADR